MQEISVSSLCDVRLPDPSLLQFYNGLKNRELWLDDDIDDWYNIFAEYIIDWNIEDAGKNINERLPIKMFISTNGGKLDTARMLIDVIEASKTPVIGINVSKAYSAGCFILLACHKRYATYGSWFLIHRGNGGAYGDNFNAQAQMEMWNRQIEQFRVFTLEHTKFNENIFDNIWKNDYFFNAQDALKNGVIDKVLYDFEEVLSCKSVDVTK